MLFARILVSAFPAALIGIPLLCLHWSIASLFFVCFFCLGWQVTELRPERGES